MRRDYQSFRWTECTSRFLLSSNPLIDRLRAWTAPFAFALFLAAVAGLGAQVSMPDPLPLPDMIHPLLARGRAAILASPGELVTIGQSGCRYPTIRAALEAAPGGNARICLMDAVHREGGIVIKGEVEILGFGAVGTCLEAAGRAEDATDRVIRVEEGEIGRAHV